MVTTAIQKWTRSPRGSFRAAIANRSRAAGEPGTGGGQDAPGAIPGTDPFDATGMGRPPVIGPAG